MAYGLPKKSNLKTFTGAHAFPKIFILLFQSLVASIQLFFIAVTKNRTVPNRTHRIEPKQSMFKSKWMMWAAISVLVVAGIIACFIFCRGGCCGKKK